MLISWKEEELNPNDEIIVMYEVKSKIGIVGNFELENASVKFNEFKPKFPITSFFDED